MGGDLDFFLYFVLVSVGGYLFWGLGFLGFVRFIFSGWGLLWFVVGFYEV